MRASSGTQWLTVVGRNGTTLVLSGLRPRTTIGGRGACNLLLLPFLLFLCAADTNFGIGLALAWTRPRGRGMRPALVLRYATPAMRAANRKSAGGAIRWTKPATAGAGAVAATAAAAGGNFGAGSARRFPTGQTSIRESKRNITVSIAKFPTNKRQFSHGAQNGREGFRWG